MKISKVRCFQCFRSVFKRREQINKGIRLDLTRVLPAFGHDALKRKKKKTKATVNHIIMRSENDRCTSSLHSVLLQINDCITTQSCCHRLSGEGKRKSFKNS